MSSSVLQKKKTTEILLAIYNKPRSIRKIRDAVRGSYSTILTRLAELEDLELIKFNDNTAVFTLT
jgi:predicted transcriptional regulator